MEKVGFIRLISEIEKEFKLLIHLISTDRHASIKKLMKEDERFIHIVHVFDPWHIGKGLIKKLIKASKRKGKGKVWINRC